MSGHFTELIPGLPEELALECLTRLHYTAHRTAGRVSHRWRHLLLSRDFYHHRNRTGRTHLAACFIQSTPVSPVFPVNSASTDPKPIRRPSYGISVFDPVTGNWDRVDPIPKYPDGLPLFCRITSSEGKLVVMGGWDPVSWDPVKDVFTYEFTTRVWVKCKDMPSGRSLFAIGSGGDRVFVAGGHDESKNALNTAWVYCTRTDEWTELARMGEERDECEGIVVGSEFWVVSGYETRSQGRFKSSAEVLDLGSGKWRRVENAWPVGQCPKSGVGVGKNGNLISGSESNPEIRVGACSVDLGGRTLMVGSEYQGAPQGFFVVEKVEGQNGKLVKVEVPDGFLGFVQSGCSIEI